MRGGDEVRARAPDDHDRDRTNASPVPPLII
jgi:hypothetical protein